MRYVVLGGGIAGVCCALELARCLAQEQEQRKGVAAAARAGPDGDGTEAEAGQVSEPDQVVLVSSSPVVKGVREVARLSRLVEELEVVETSLEELAAQAGAGAGGLMRVVRGEAVGLELGRRVLLLKGGASLVYDKLCLCTGARPKELEVPGARHPAVLTLRDTDSVQELARRLRGCRRLVLVGNGGIALELAGALLRLQEATPPSGRLVGRPGLGPVSAASPAGRAASSPDGASGGPGAGAAAGPSWGAGAAGCEGREGGEVGRSLGDRSPPAAAPTAVAAAPQRPELVWVLKHGHVGDAFLDRDAAEFLLRYRLQPRTEAAEAAGGGTAAALADVTAVQPGGSGSAIAISSSPPNQGEGAEQRQRQQGGVGAGEVGGGGGGGGTEATRVRGHAAGPAWTQELLRGLEAEAEAERQGQGQQQRPRSAAGEGSGAAGDTAKDTAGGTAGGTAGAGMTASAGSGEKVTASAGGGGGGGGCGGGGFRLVLEFSTTVTRLEDGGGGSGGGGGADGRGGAVCGGGATDTAPGQAAAAAAATAAAAEVEGGAREGGPWPVHVGLSNGKVYGTDLVVCGIGVEPATEWLPPQLTRGSDGGVAVGRDMRTADRHVFAAGDCCSADWPDGSPHWFQMRLWSQARVMGTYAARCMLGCADELACGFNFELFTHVTRFLGAKVVLLGLFNGQRLEHEAAEDIRLYSRIADAVDGSGVTFVRVLMLRGRMQGAVLLGETELEEALENIILDGLDLSMYGSHIIDPDFELEHVFD